MTFEDCKMLMEDRGYILMNYSVSGNEKQSVNFIIQLDTIQCGIGATCDLKEETIELTYNHLKYFMHISTGPFSITHPEFRKYEKIIEIYANRCDSINPLNYL